MYQGKTMIFRVLFISMDTVDSLWYLSVWDIKMLAFRNQLRLFRNPFILRIL